MIEWLEKWLQADDTKLIYVLIAILIATMIDFILGWCNAKFNKDVQFSSTVANFGIIKKIIYFILLVFFIPVALIFGHTVAIPALYILYLGYLMSELTSILNHLNIGSDDKQGKMFADFIKNLFGKDSESK